MTVYIAYGIGVTVGIALGWMIGSWRAHRRYMTQLDDLTKFHTQLNRRS